MPATDIEKFIETYTGVLDFIDKNNLRKDIYYPIRQYDLEKFMDKINSFTSDTLTILGNISHHESKSKVMAIYKDKHKIKDKIVKKKENKKEETKGMDAEQKQKAIAMLKKSKDLFKQNVTS